MKKYAYLNRLEELLAELPAERRNAVLQRYRDALETADADREEAVFDALDTPEEVAARILQGREEVPELSKPCHNVILFMLALALLLVLAFGISALGASPEKGTPPTAYSETE